MRLVRHPAPLRPVCAGSRPRAGLRRAWRVCLRSRDERPRGSAAEAVGEVDPKSGESQDGLRMAGWVRGKWSAASPRGGAGLRRAASRGPGGLRRGTPGPQVGGDEVEEGAERGAGWHGRSGEAARQPCSTPHRAHASSSSESAPRRCTLAVRRIHSRRLMRSGLDRVGERNEKRVRPSPASAAPSGTHACPRRSSRRR
jgi:hypothetical protein